MQVGLLHAVPDLNGFSSFYSRKAGTSERTSSQYLEKGIALVKESMFDWTARFAAPGTQL